ncbi:unnamed protein product, partial [marine sediment metagenome]
FVESGPLQYKFHISTNGVFTEEVLNYLSDKNFDVTVSMDGSPDTNDKYRTFPDGSGTASTIAETIKKLAQRKIHFNVRITISKTNVADIPTAIKYFSSLGVRFVHIELVSECIRAKREQIIQPNREEYLKYIKQGIQEASKKNMFLW